VHGFGERFRREHDRLGDHRPGNRSVQHQCREERAAAGSASGVCHFDSPSVMIVRRFLQKMIA
jgi:hypothetical protein